MVLHFMEHAETLDKYRRKLSTSWSMSAEPSIPSRASSGLPALISAAKRLIAGEICITRVSANPDMGISPNVLNDPTPTNGRTL
jgi:hypothetical protein